MDDAVSSIFCLKYVFLFTCINMEKSFEISNSREVKINGQKHELYTINNDKFLT